MIPNLFSKVALKDDKSRFIVMNSNEAESSTEMISQADSAIAKLPPWVITPNNSPQEERVYIADIHPP